MRFIIDLVGANSNTRVKIGNQNVYCSLNPDLTGGPCICRPIDKDYVYRCRGIRCTLHSIGRLRYHYDNDNVYGNDNETSLLFSLRFCTQRDERLIASFSSSTTTITNMNPGRTQEMMMSEHKNSVLVLVVVVRSYPPYCMQTLSSIPVSLVLISHYFSRMTSKCLAFQTDNNRGTLPFMKTENTS